MSVRIVNLGCKVNRVESDAAAAALSAQGVSLEGEPVEVVVVNTCTVTGEAEKKTRKAVSRALREHAGALVLVTGCAAAVAPDEFTAMDGRVRVVPKDRVVDACLAHLGVAPTTQPNVRFGGAFPTRVGVKVQDGCDNACAYCIVHVARGRSRSVTADEVLSVAGSHVRAGARELVLTGIDLAAYRDGGVDLAGLLLRLRAAFPETRLRVGSVEPTNVTDGLIDVLAEQDGMVCRHLHLPLQSGSTPVLRAMARPYDADGFLRLVERLYDRVPLLSLSTDAIVGFPGENDADFARTVAVARACRFSKMHVFRYSRRAGTPAATWPDQVPADMSAARSEELQAVAAQLRADEARARVGTRERVLVEQDGRGMSESYFRVRTADLPRGALETCTLTRLGEDGIFEL